MKILITLAFFLTMSISPGQGAVSFFHHFKCDIENTSASNTNDKSDLCVVSADEEITVDIQDNPAPSILFIKEKHVLLTCFFPHKLYYSIWLPPEVS